MTMRDRASRRTLLRTGVVAGAAVLAGCSGGDDPASSDESGDGGEPTVVFEDDFEDGDYTSDPAWEEPMYPDDVGGTPATVASRSSPAGGTTGVEVTDVTDPRYQSPLAFTLADPMEGMDGAWTLSGLFTPTEIPDVVDERYVAISCYWPYDGNFGDRGWLQFRPGHYLVGEDDPTVLLRTQERSNREWSIPAEAPASPLDTDQWYRWELAHDGAGSYSAARWPADGDRDDGTSVEAAFTAPDAPVSFSLRTFTSVTDVNGESATDPGERPFSIHHDYVRRTEE